MNSLVVLGTQWGDEGKGKIVDWYAKDFDYIVRYSGGDNAGHTVKLGREVFKFHLIPSGILHPDKINVLSNGMVINPATLLDGAEEARQRILEGDFPDYIVKRFSDMLNYFGQSPIIVRSSSLLEDNFGNAFSGKYESVFCTNQGTHQKRLEEFINAVRLIYASSMSEKALSYRAQRNVLEQDEQMALLVQRVSGKPYGKFFFPQLAGVGLSYNPYVWDESIDPEAGVLRLVFGLGTRAVNRFDDDYTRMVALNEPDKHPGADFDEVARYSQKKVDILNLAEDSFASSFFWEYRATSLKSAPGCLSGALSATMRV